MFRRLTPVAKNILIINASIFLIDMFFSFSLVEYFGLRVAFSEYFAPYQFITYMWLHSGMWHLVGNMVAVLVFAPTLESIWGSKRFLIFYFACGIGAALLYGVVDYAEKLPLKQESEAYVANPSPESFENYIINHKKILRNISGYAELLKSYYENPALENTTVEVVESIYYAIITNGVMIGASGAVFGILFAFAFLFPNAELFLLFPPIPIKAKYLVLFYGLYELYAEFNRSTGDNIAHLAHLSGILIAFLLLKFWKQDFLRR